MRFTIFVLVLFLWPTLLVAQPKLLCTLTIPGSRCFGYNLTSGDFNGDGYADIVSNDYQDPGRVWLFFGPNFNSSLVFNCFDPWEGFGVALANVSDFNGDGAPDLAIGAPDAFVPGAYYGAGKVYLYFGGAEMDDQPDAVFAEQNSWYYHFGCAIKGADFTGDGYSDLAIGAHNDDLDERGRVFIYYGGSEVDTTYDLRLEGLPLSHFGWHVGSGDFDGDGIADLVVGAPNEIPGGAAYIFLSPPDTIAEVKLTDANLGWFGSLGTVGDFDGDMLSELIVSDPCWYWSNVLADTSHDLSFGGSTSLASGDFNQDGVDDLLRGYYIYGSDDRGWVSLYFGGQSFDTIAEIELQGENSRDQFWQVASAGDVNNDGWTDFAIGAPGWNSGQGKVYIYTLNPELGIKGEEKPRAVKPPLALQSFPNPFSSLTTIAYTLPTSSYINLSIYNLTGQLVEILVDRQEEADEHTIRWSGGKRVSAGVYLLRLRAGTLDLCKKINKIK